MNFIKLTILLVIAFVINLMISYSSNLLISNSHRNVSRNSNLNGKLPNAFRVNFFFNDDNYEHTHTFNGGVYQINVEVNGSPSFLSSGKLNQMDCDLNCFINSPNSALSSRINIQQTITVFGKKEESEMKEMFRNSIVDIILKEIKKI